MEPRARGMACPGDARADGPPSPDRGAPFRGSWLSTWAGDDTRPAGQQTVLKSGVVWVDTISGIDVRHPSWSSGTHLPTASLTFRFLSFTPDSRARSSDVLGLRLHWSCLDAWLCSAS